MFAFNFRDFVLITSILRITGTYGQTATTVTVSTTSSHAIPTTLWGQMFEDISSGDGGLYAEILQNRAFQQVTPNTPEALNAWNAINGAEIAVIAETVPVSSALPNALQLTIPSGRFGPVGFGNEGFWGIKVDPTLTYTASFYYRFPNATSFHGNIVVGLQTSTGLFLGDTSVTISGAQTTWLQVTTTIKPAQAPFNNNNNFTLTIDGTAGAGQTINFAMLSLFPPTFRSRPNGVRLDIANALLEMAPTFFRLPGGNNLEVWTLNSLWVGTAMKTLFQGQTLTSRWQWNNTVGLLLDRPGRMGDYGYVNTDGLGLYELLLFCQDIGMQPIMAVWSGVSLDGSSVSDADLAPFIQQAIDQINFVIGVSGSSAPASLRASLGHSAPFTMTYVEIGNKDFMASETYLERWRLFVSALSQNFPQLRFIATSNAFNPILTPDPTDWDVHVYQTPNWFAENSFYYDSFERNGTNYMEGEYAAVATTDSGLAVPAYPNGTGNDGTRLPYPTMQSAVGEAAFMTGLERNSDIVFAASYAPVLNNVASTDWSPNLLSFDLNNVYRSTSFYVQKMFSTNRGDTYFPSTLPDPNGTLFWSVTRNTSPALWIIKIVNIAESPSNLTFVLPISISTGTVTLLNGGLTDSNTPATPNLVVAPVAKAITVVRGTAFNYTAPPVSVSVLRLT